MKLCLPSKLFGRRYRPIKHGDKARLKTLWNTSLPVPPPIYDVDSQFTFTIPPRVYNNDVEGDCVIAARANQETRIFALESGSLLSILDSEVQSEYMLETGGIDSGLVPEDSLATWQTRGWFAGGLHHQRISAWGRVDATNVVDVQRCIWLLHGMQLGVELPLIWQTAINSKQPWDVPPDLTAPDAQLGSWGGHQIYIKAYNETGVMCLTWGMEQWITWAGLAWIGSVTNMGEAEGVVPSNVSGLFPKTDTLDLVALLNDLAYLDKN